jgi:outer membrane protein OmpA-like peptidoglycan-associated protein
LIFAGFLVLLGAGWYFWGDAASDQLARWGKAKEAREAQGPAAGERSGRLGSAPPLPVETGPREPKPAEPSADAVKAPSLAVPETAAAAAPKPEAKEPPSAPEPAIAEPKSVPPPPAIPTLPAAPPAAEPFKLKDFTVYFAQNSTEISIPAREVLATAAALLKSNPRTAGIIEGHTDSTGDFGYNKLISENRAVSVKNYLVAQGIASSRLSVSTFGSEKPIDTNNTQEGRSKNRRVVIRIVPAKQG